ncbi:MAG: transposase [Deltaproteobacteria bacterium]|jgi:transposase|nr:transposase [Deltaproteobacteria bacterium]
MAGITATNENGCLRLYRTFSYRDENNKPQRARKLIGKVDPISGKNIFNHFFKNILLSQNLNIDEISALPYRDISKIVNLGETTKNKIINRIPRNVNGADYVVYSNKDNHNNGTNIDSEQKIIDKNSNDTDLINNSDNIITIQTYNGKKYTVKEINYIFKGFGPKLLLDMAIGKTGLYDILTKVFPMHWDKILTVAYYLVSDNSAVSYCEDWLEQNESILIEEDTLISQGISELFIELKQDKIMYFWELWSNHMQENEYSALDITSISSYANLIYEFEYGHNRDKEKLPQINFCMLFGEKSGLPAFSSAYNGSLNDTKILKSFLEKLEFFGDKKYKLVMDKGFYSKFNISLLLQKYKKYDFMIAVPFTTSIAREIVSNGIGQLEQDKPILLNNDNLVGNSFIKKLNNEHSVIYHAIFNEYKYDDAKKCLKDKATELRNTAILNPIKYINEKEYKKYLLFQKDKLNDNYIIKINLERINFELKHVGWLIIVSNDINTTYQQALEIYRNKDRVEKSFDTLKNSLSLKRLHIHQSRSLYGKIFVAMISLILSSYIHNVLVKNNLDSKYTITKLLKKLETLKIDKSGDISLISPITKEMKNIFTAFDIQIF